MAHVTPFAHGVADTPHGEVHNNHKRAYSGYKFFQGLKFPNVGFFSYFVHVKPLDPSGIFFKDLHPLNAHFLGTTNVHILDRNSSKASNFQM